MNSVSGSSGPLKDWSDDLRLAVGLLTRVPVPHPDGAAPSYLARAPRVFPLVGAAIGLFVGCVYLTLTGLDIPATVAAALALGASAWITGALHEDGLADVADGFGGGRTKERKLEIMRDSRLGTYGTLAVLISFTTKLFALAALPGAVVLPALVTAHALGRAAIPALSAKLPLARADGLAAGVGQTASGVAVTAAVLGLVVALVMLPVGVALIACALAVIATLAVGRLALRQIGGTTGDVFGAAEQAIEIAVLVLCASLHGRGAI